MLHLGIMRLRDAPERYLLRSVYHLSDLGSLSAGGVENVTRDGAASHGLRLALHVPQFPGAMFTFALTLDIA
jgi:hypothetical protein